MKPCVFVCVYIYIDRHTVTDFWKRFTPTCSVQKVQNGGTKLLIYVAKYSSLHDVMFRNIPASAPPQWKVLTNGT